MPWGFGLPPRPGLQRVDVHAVVVDRDLSRVAPYDSAVALRWCRSGLDHDEVAGSTKILKNRSRPACACGDGQPSSVVSSLVPLNVFSRAACNGGSPSWRRSRRRRER